MTIVMKTSIMRQMPITINNDDDNIGDDDINDNVADDVNDNEDIFDDADDSDDNDDWDCNTIATMIKVVMIMTTQKMFLLKH